MTIYFASKNPNSYVTGKRFMLDRPAPTVMAAGLAGDSIGHWHIYGDTMTEKEWRVINDTSGWTRDLDITDDPAPTITASSQSQYTIELRDSSMQKKTRQIEKPLYRVPLMSEIQQIPWNGITVASTFSGAGGSCTGYRMAGCRVVWANEFVPAAQASYKANASEHCVLDGRDIRQVKATDIFKATGLKKGELDIFDGSPPCQAFSRAGKRDKGWGEQKKYDHGAKQANEELFFEYIRLLNELKPRAFIAENVSGLLQGTAKGFFKLIMRGLKETGYTVKCKLLDASWLGVPQYRRRAIFIGVREDQGFEPVFPKPMPYQYTVRDALPWLNELKVRNWRSTQPNITDEPSTTIMTTPEGSGFNRKGYEIETDETHTDIVKMRLADGFGKDKFVDPDSQPFQTVLCSPNAPVGTANAGKADFKDQTGDIKRRRFRIEELKRICAFPDDFVLKGSYAKQWERLGNSVPPVMMKSIAEPLIEKLNAKK